MSQSELIPGTNQALNELCQREICAAMFSSNALKHAVHSKTYIVSSNFHLVHDGKKHLMVD